MIFKEIFSLKYFLISKHRTGHWSREAHGVVPGKIL